ncbi:MAG: winged helix-turn-helix transcriptional regulator, partial [Rhodococcus sp. (in: high G+C Gram-positive bacteria)]|uniref:winged helix-turn-helix transcriptional regulator n=1 Tax=Rhodococcus sp. TaxID=1831 RepID=UPI003D9B6AC8
MRRAVCRKHGRRAVRSGTLRRMTSLDGTDARLLLELARTPRATGVELSQRLGLSRNTVQARLSRWESEGVLASF